MDAPHDLAAWHQGSGPCVPRYGDGRSRAARAGDPGGTASSAGVAFTVSLLIASRGFDEPSLADAKLALLAVNVGLPREIEWEGTTVHTAIYKQPVTGPRMVRPINIDGDDQADRDGHGGEHRAVFFYQIGSYRYWERELGRDDFTYGQFGENFTVAGLADDEVCVGDRYRIGEALFEVTQPRVTCFRWGSG